MYYKLIDHHTHTNKSPDADQKLTFEDYIKVAIDNHISGVMFTDHLEIDYPSPIFNQVIDYVKYHQEIEVLRNKYSLDIKMGVELGYQPKLISQFNQILSNSPFDFVICSMHMCDNLDLYNGDFFIGKTQKESYQRYFENVLDSVINYDNYDVYGHIDYIYKYGNFEVRDYTYSDFKDIIDDILKVIIQKNKGIEVNTSGLRYGLLNLHPKFDIIKRYYELGGRLITLGSDAHRLKDFQNDFEIAIDLLKQAGFKEITQYHLRVPYQIKI
jgi:histidinol-phosphatase (PHP family)